MRTEVAGPRRGLGAAAVCLLVSMAMTPGADAVDIGQDPGAVCVNGWATAGSPSAILGATAVDVTVQNGTQWVAGSENQEDRSIAAYTARSAVAGWSTVPLGPTNSKSLLTGISTDGPGGLWVAGERVDGGGQTQPLIEHWNGRDWTESPVPRLPHGGALSDITQVGPQVALAVGFGADLVGQHAVAYTWTPRTRWRLTSPPLAGFSALTAVASAPDHTTWAVGWVQTASGYRPLLEQRVGTSWHRATLNGSGSIVFTGITVLSKSSAWAVGFRQVDGSISGIVAHWDGHNWNLDPGLTVTAAGGSILRAIAIIGGNVTAVGMSWDTSYKDSTPIVAQRTGTTWSVQGGVAGITAGELIGVAGGTYPVAVGRSSGRAIAIVPCTPGHSPSGSGGQVGGTGALGAAVGEPGSAAAAGTTDETGAMAGSGAARLVTPRIPRRVTRRSLPPPRTIPGLQIQDVTASAGLTMTTLTYNGMSADLNGDGWPDLIIGRHAQHPLLVLLNQANGTFAQVDNPFRQADRHGCAVGNIDSEPQPEIVCAIGANHGLGIKDNEVWLSPLDPSAPNAADALGLADPLGRGRRTALLDYNHDGLMDVYFANDPSRPDALPGSNYLFRNVDNGTFVPAPEAGLDLGVGAQCLTPVDIDGDGWTDLIDCEYIQMAAYSALHIFHNNHGHFVDWTNHLGINGLGIFDAVPGDLNHDGKMDLVTLSQSGLDVWLQAGGTLHRAYSLWVPHGAAIALADVNGDKKPDIYIVRGEPGGGTVQDVLLLNNGTGTGFTSVQLPAAQPGPGGDAFPIDYDKNGRQDILVMHGSNRKEGPIQLLAFGPPWPLELPAAASPPPEPTSTPNPSASSTPVGSPAASSQPSTSPSASGGSAPSPSPSPRPSSRHRR